MVEGILTLAPETEKIISLQRDLVCRDSSALALAVHPVGRGVAMFLQIYCRFRDQEAGLLLLLDPQASAC